MRYAQIRSMDISNGKDIGVALFVQGCHLHCHNCFNSDTWDFNGGKEWTADVKNTFMKLIEKDYIKRVSFLGGDPLAEENCPEILKLIREIKDIYKNNKKIWLYSGYTFEVCWSIPIKKEILSYCDIMVDGAFIDSLKDLSLEFRGSSNQRIIDVQKTIKNMEKGEIILWDSLKEKDIKKLTSLNV